MTTRKAFSLSPLALTALTFLAGALAGTILGSFSGAALLRPMVADAAKTGGTLQGFLRTYILFAFFSALAFLFGTSLIGRRVIPFFAFLRGLCLGCGAAVLLCAGAGREAAALQIGFPAFFSVPAFFFLAEDGILSSDIIRLCSGSGLIRSCENVNLRRVAAAALLLALAAAAKNYWVPLIL